MIERIRSLLTAWAQLSDQEREAVNEVLLWQLYKMTREDKNEGFIEQHFTGTDSNDQRDQGTYGADGYLGLVADTGSDPIRSA